MITKEKLGLNLDILRNIIPKKPAKYTPQHPLNLKEALTLYSRQTSVHSIQHCTRGLYENNWPLILWVNPHNIKFGIFNKILLKRYDFSQRKKKKLNWFKDFNYLFIPFMNELIFKIKYDDTIMEGFDANKMYIQNQLKSNPLLTPKIFLIEGIFKAYKNENWVTCVCTILPLLDFVSRKILNTKNLRNDIGKICKLFEQNGFGLDSVDDLMPHLSMVKRERDKPQTIVEMHKIYEKVKDNEFGIIGPALSSFLRFANQYYKYYTEDVEEENVINRHAILHGSVNLFGNKANIIKLITFLYLMLELEPVFEILLKEK